MNEFGPNNIPIIEVKSKADLLLVESRVKESVKRITSHFEGKEPEIIALGTALMSLGQLKELNSDLNHELDSLMAESERLIDSPSADTSEVRAERKVIADRINEVLATQQEFAKHYMNIQEAENLIRMSPPDKVAKAQEIVDLVIAEGAKILNPVTGLN